MVTTIQLHSNVKKELEKFRVNSKESYQDIILRLMRSVEAQKRLEKNLLIEGCKIMAEDSLKINKEWKQADVDLNWGW